MCLQVCVCYEYMYIHVHVQAHVYVTVQECDCVFCIYRERPCVQTNTSQATIGRSSCGKQHISSKKVNIIYTYTYTPQYTNINVYTVSMYIT